MMSSRSQIYKLVQDLHNIGITHKDLEPWNIARVQGGRFHLIDFSQSRKHICKERQVQYTTTNEVSESRPRADQHQKWEICCGNSSPLKVVLNLGERKLYSLP